MRAEIIKKNSQYCFETLALKRNIEMNFLELGKRLRKIREEELYKPNYEDFAEFCLEIKLSGPTVSKLINIYDVFVLQYKVSPKVIASAGGWSVIAETLPFVNNKKDAENLLHKATVLTRSDLRRELIELKKGVPMAECKHENAYHISCCPDCGIRLREYDKKA